MSQYVYVEDQEVAYNSGVLLNDSIPCRKGLVLHQNGSANLTVRGIVNNPCRNAFARYRVFFSGNIAVPTGGTVGEISLSVAVNGEPVAYSLSAVTPTVVDAFFNVSGSAYVDVLPYGSPTVTIRNTSATEAAITTRNMSVQVERIA